MDENNHIFHSEPLEANTPLPQSPTWNLSADPLSAPNYEVKQYLCIPKWTDGGRPATTYHTIIDYMQKQFVVAVHGIYTP